MKHSVTKSLEGIPSMIHLSIATKESFPFVLFRTPTYHLRVTVEGSEVEGRAAVLVGVVGGGSALHQAAHDRQVSLQTGPAQSRQTLLIHQRQGGTWQKEDKGLKNTHFTLHFKVVYHPE